MSQLDMANRSSSPPAHTLPADEVLRSLNADRGQGLSSPEVERRRGDSGFNELAQAAATPWWRRLLAQFQELVILILIASALISGALGEWVDTGAILAIVMLNGLLGFFQEQHA